MQNYCLKDNEKGVKEVIKWINCSLNQTCNSNIS